MIDLNQERSEKDRLAKQALDGPVETPGERLRTESGHYALVFLIGALAGFALGMVILLLLGRETLEPAIVAAIIGGFLNVIAALIKSARQEIRK